MSCDLYLINPKEGAPGYFGLEVFEAWSNRKVARLADLSTITVAAFAPGDWTVRICDERVEAVDLDVDARFVGITGKVSQSGRMKELADEFRRRGKTVLIGGSYASLSPDDVRPYADILVRGEIEAIAADLFADLSSGNWQREYVGDKPSLAGSPIPRWDLYPRHHAISAQVQTSRGCPFECEFCDVIQYLGRKQRWKEPPEVLAELDVIARRGYPHVFFADDNLTVVRRRAVALVDALHDWNRQPGRSPITFSTQVSIDVAREGDLLEKMVAAGFEHVFIGVETVNEASLAETGKRQNLRIDQVEKIEAVVAKGLMVTAGLIVGFDSDGPDIFERQAEFVARMPVPLANLGLLVAPDATPLHARLKAAGRIVENGGQAAGSTVATNIVPLQMTREDMSAGIVWLMNWIFDPDRYAARVLRFVNLCGRRPHSGGVATGTSLYANPVLAPLARRLAASGAAELRLLHTLETCAARRPDLRQTLGSLFVQFCQVRHMLEHDGILDRDLACRDRPVAARLPAAIPA